MAFGSAVPRGRVPWNAQMAKIDQWLEELGLGRYAAVFSANDIDFDVLPDLSDKDLAALGVSLGHRKKLLRAIAALGEANMATAAPAAPGRPIALHKACPPKPGPCSYHPSAAPANAIAARARPAQAALRDLPGPPASSSVARNRQLTAYGTARARKACGDLASIAPSDAAPSSRAAVPHGLRVRGATG